MPWYCWFASGVLATLAVEALAIMAINWLSRQTD